MGGRGKAKGEEGKGKEDGRGHTFIPKLAVPSAMSDWGEKRGYTLSSTNLCFLTRFSSSSELNTWWPGYPINNKIKINQNKTKIEQK